MKKNRIAILWLMLTLLLCSCNNVSSTYETSNNNTEQVLSELTQSTLPAEEASQNITAEIAKEDLSKQKVMASNVSLENNTTLSLSSIPAYTASPYIVINNNVPRFTSAELVTDSFENYSSQDSLGRCGVAYANIGTDLMPTEARGSIGSVKPTGWQSIKYDNVDGNYLYNRCHLIAFELAGENANVNNLITGTRYMNISGMLPFENLVTDYIKETKNHVLYRVTPLYESDDLVAHGVEMEGFSVEDSGSGICFHIFCYNIQPGITIDYATGNSALSSSNSTTETVATTLSSTVADISSTTTTVEQNYILNTNTKKFHKPSCSSVDTIKDENKEEFTGNREDLINQGYAPCKICNP